MLMGTLARPEFHMGESLIPADTHNPKGYFESARIKRINERIIKPITHDFPPILQRNLKGAGPVLRRWLFPFVTKEGFRVFAHIPLREDVPDPSGSDQALIQSFLRKRPFLYKDPRFCYTLPHWRDFVPESKVLVIFRDPRKTARSMIDYVRGNSPEKLSMTHRQALYIVRNLYERVLTWYEQESDGEDNCENRAWLFLHQDQVLDGTAFDRLEAFTEGPVDHNFPDPSLTCAEGEERVLPDAVRRTYHRLCSLANYDPQDSPKFRFPLIGQTIPPSRRPKRDRSGV